MNPIEWLEAHYAMEIVFLLTMLAVSVILGTMALRVFRTGFTRGSAWGETPEAMIKKALDERLRILEFDTAMVLMEKQRLKKLEIDALELQLRLNGAKSAESQTPTRPASPAHAGGDRPFDPEGKAGIAAPPSAQ